MKEIRVENGLKLRIVTNNKGEQFVLQGFVVGGYYLIPYDGKPYWEHHFVDKDTWIPMCNLDYREYDITPTEFLQITKMDDKSYEEILAKYHGSF